MRVLCESQRAGCERALQAGSGQGLLLFRVEGGGGWCFSRLEGQGYPGSLQQVQSSCHYLSSQASRLGGSSARKDCKARIDVLMRLGTHDEAGLPSLEAVVADLLAELDEFSNFKESCWCNIGVREQEVPGWSQGGDGFRNENPPQVQ